MPVSGLLRTQLGSDGLSMPKYSQFHEYPLQEAFHANEMQ